MRVKYRIVIVAVAAISSCNMDHAVSESERLRIDNDVRRTLNDYFTDISRDGLTAEFKYLDASEDFFWVPPGYGTAISYDSVAAILKLRAPRYRSVNNTWDSLRVTILTRELASYNGRLHSTMTDRSGNVSEYNLVETGLLIKRENGWKLLSGQTSVIDLQ